jgi:hypothetical protein
MEALVAAHLSNGVAFDRYKVLQSTRVVWRIAS